MQKNKIEILEVGFDNMSMYEVIDRLNQILKGPDQHFLTTPNPEILLKAKEDQEYKNVINKASIAVPDGTGIIWAADFLYPKDPNRNRNKFLRFLFSYLSIPFRKNKGRILKSRVTGVDIINEISRNSSERGYSIFLLGAQEGIAKIAAENLQSHYPGINIVGTFSGSPRKKDQDSIVKLINLVKPNTLLVAYGAPNQELWINENLKKMPSVKIAIGVGGAFDFLAGKRKRAPKWLQKIGLEWLFRVIQEPRRLKRIFNAVVKFPIVVYKSAK